MSGGPGRRRGAHVAGVPVVDHRTLAARVVEQPGGEPHLPHALGRGRQIPGVGERIPRTEPHQLL